jgi:hypothetical protein
LKIRRDDGMVTREDRVRERRKGGKADREERTYGSTKDATLEILQVMQQTQQQFGMQMKFSEQYLQQQMGHSRICAIPEYGPFQNISTLPPTEGNFCHPEEEKCDLIIVYQETSEGDKEVNI